MSPLYQLHGLRLRSEIPLSAGFEGTALQKHDAAKRQQADVQVKKGPDRSVPGEPPAAELLSELTLPGGAGYSLTESENGYLLRFYRTCEIEISKDLKSLRVFADPAADPGLVPLLVEGNAVAVVLGLRGHFVLHASAVSTGEGAVGFVGAAGMGKSTMAAVMCASGASLVADDLLCVEFEERRVICHRGPQVVRLRPGAASLADAINGQISASPDGRTTVALTANISETPTLQALIIPQPSRSAVDLNVRRLSPQEALLQLSRYPRVTGWKIDEPWRIHFRGAAQAARKVPVYVAEILWGPPFDDHLAGHLLEALGIATPQEDKEASQSGAT